MLKNLRELENKLYDDNDYIILQDTQKIIANEKEYFAVYNLLKENPEKTAAENDLNMLELMYGEKRLWYRVGAYMASRIDEEFGRKKLVDLLKDKPPAFINLYLETK